MKNSNWRMTAAAGLALSLAGAAHAQTAPLDQSRAYASEMLSDAETRTNSLAAAPQDFTVNVHGFTQLRYNVNYRRDDIPAGNIAGKDNKWTTGFQNARTKLQIAGNIANENWGYFVQFKFEDPGSGTGTLDDAYGTYKSGNGWKWTFGQFKLPLFREELVGDIYQLFANRSVVNSVFTQSRSQGVQLGIEQDAIQGFLAFSDGLGTKNTDYTSNNEADYAFTGRLNWKWAGAWKQAQDFTSFQGSEFFGMVGVAGHYQKGGDTVGTADVQLGDLTADVSIEGNGWNVFAAGIYSHVDPKGGTKLDDFAAQIQGGFFVAPQWELIAGWDAIFPDSDRGAGSDHNFNTVRGGFNYYFVPESHTAKLTVDVSYFVDKQNQSIAPQNTQTGLLTSGKDGQWNLRAQMQLVF